MHAHTLKVLEYRRVLERLAAHTASAMGREAALALEPSCFPEIVRRRLQETREARALLDSGHGIPLGGICDIREAVDRAAIGITLSPMELLDAGQTLGAARRLRAFLCKQGDEHPLLTEIAGNIRVPAGIEARIAECIAESGDVRDTATPELARARGQRKVAHGRLLDRLNRVLSSDRYRTFIQEPIITEREGRYCIPVKAENRTQLGGIVHDASASGATVFVEPGPCVELGNAVKELAIQEEREVARILARLSAMIADAADDLRGMLAMLANLDAANAKALLAEEMGASDVRFTNRGVVRLYSARHPLLPGDVVPVDVEVGERYTVLLLTGPNTGGKTVTLKTIGLISLMAQSGMQIPASPDSELCLFEQVFADIGDEQDIQQSLSTFSAHLKNIVEIIATMTASSLVLLDEVGAGTDPAEGAALAKSVLDEMIARGARVVATTHYGELKEYAYSRDGVENAAVEFDRETLRPTYRVLHGVPGSSHAFYIAGRLGMPPEVIERANGMLSDRERESAELLQQIEASRGRAYEMERDAAAARRAAEDARRDYEQRVQQVTDVQRTIKREAAEEAKLVLRRVSERAENLIGELQKMNRGSRKATGVRRQLAELRQEAAGQLAEPEPEPETPPPPGGWTFAAGDRVHVTTLGADGTVLAAPAGATVVVQVGSMHATLPVSVLRPSAAAPSGEPERKRSNASEASMRRAIHIAPEVMIRAMRVDEASPLLDRYMDDAFAAGIHEVRVIHGKGTGALRKFVWEFLKSHPAVASFRLGEDGEGGEGATVVTFKD